MKSLSLIAAGAVMALAMAGPSARADGWHGGWGGPGWGWHGGGWHGHGWYGPGWGGWWRGPSVGVVIAPPVAYPPPVAYYPYPLPPPPPPPPVVYAPPPVVYAPPPVYVAPPGVSIGVNIPIR
ncbi:MAG TPA: hypothetical protein VG848_13665 [Acetobacteraceae bacterium]|nr:hypothetical protein [Acetobacteraceae bacterium]